MANTWTDERRVWGLLFDVKRQVKEIEKELKAVNGYKIPEQPPKAAGA